MGGRNESRNGVRAIIAATRNRACNTETVRRIPDGFVRRLSCFGGVCAAKRYVSFPLTKRCVFRERNYSTFRQAARRIVYDRRSLIVRRQWRATDDIIYRGTPIWPFELGWDDFVSLIFSQTEPLWATCMTIVAAIHTIHTERRQSVASRRTRQSTAVEPTSRPRRSRTVTKDPRTYA